MWVFVWARLWSKMKSKLYWYWPIRFDLNHILNTLDIDLVRAPSYRTRHMYCGSTCMNNGTSVAEICHFSPYLVNITLSLTATTWAWPLTSPMTSHIASASQKTYNLISTSSKSKQYLLRYATFCFGLTRLPPFWKNIYVQNNCTV